MGLLFILIFLYKIDCDKIEDAILTEEERYLRHLRESCLQTEGIVRIFESSKSRLE